VSGRPAGERAVSAAEAAIPSVPRAFAVAFHAYVLLALGACVGPGLVPHLGLPLLLLSFAFGCRAVVLLRAGEASGGLVGDGWLYVGLSALATVPLLAPPTGLRAYDLVGEVFPVAAVALLGVHAAGDERARRIALPAIVLPALALQLAAPLAVPHPMIDVWAWTQHCARSLLHGVHPYTVRAPDIYRGGYDYGYTTTVYPYLPLNLLLAAPGVALLGDYRYVLAVAAVAAVALLRAAGRRLGVAPRLLDVVTLALALHPRAAFVIALGWKEPLLLLALAAFVYMHARKPRGAAEASAFFALPALKQYVVAPVLLYVGMRGVRPRPRALLVGMLAATATVAPFLLWNARATVDGALFAMRHTSFRDDSLSVTAVLARFTGWRFGKVLGSTAQLAVGAVAGLALRDRGLGGFLLASGMALFASFLLGSQAFVNYYYFVAALLLCAAMAVAGRPGRTS